MREQARRAKQKKTLRVPSEVGVPLDVADLAGVLEHLGKDVAVAHPGAFDDDGRSGLGSADGGLDGSDARDVEAELQGEGPSFLKKAHTCAF